MTNCRGCAELSVEVSKDGYCACCDTVPPNEKEAARTDAFVLVRLIRLAIREETKLNIARRKAEIEDLFKEDTP